MSASPTASPSSSPPPPSRAPDYLDLEPVDPIGPVDSNGFMLVRIPGSGRTVECHVAGSGPDLMFLHGPWGLDSRALDAAPFAADFRTISPRFPGTGRSDGAEGIDSVFEAALHHFDVARALGLGPLVLVGHSMGGMIAAEMAAMRPRDIAALVLIAPLGLWNDKRPVADFFTWSPQVAAERLFFDPAHPEAVRMRQTPEAHDTARIDEHVEHARALSAAGRILWPIPERGLAERLHRIEAPCLLVWGREDRVVDYRYSNDFAHRMPDFDHELVVIGDAGHMVIRERADMVRSHVTESLRRFAGAAATGEVPRA